MKLVSKVLKEQPGFRVFKDKQALAELQVSKDKLALEQLEGTDRLAFKAKPVLKV